MKTGLTLEQLAAEITRQQSAKEDYVVNTGNLRLESYGPDLTLRVLDSDGADRIEPLEIGDIAHRQIGTHLSIPAKYYERMRSEDPGLLAHNVNTWLERTPAQRMIRVLDGKARAYRQLGRRDRGHRRPPYRGAGRLCGSPAGSVSQPATFHCDRRDDYLCETQGITANAPRERKRHPAVYAAELAQFSQLRVRQQSHHPGAAL